MGRHLGRRRRSVTVVVPVAALVLAAAAAGGGYLLLRTKGSPQQTAASYLAGWQHGDYAAMDRVSVNAPRSGLAGPLRQAAAELGLRRIRLVPGPVTVSGGSAQARFTATADLASGHVWPRPAASRLVVGYRGGLAFAVLVEGGGTGPTARARSPTRSCASCDPARAPRFKLGPVTHVSEVPG
jgi:hypothetical protein